MCLCTLRAYVPSCLKLLRAYVPSWLKLLRAYVPKCPYFLRAYVPSFFTYLRAYVPIYIFQAYVLRAINYFVPTCAHFSRAYVKISHKIYWDSLLYFVLLFFFGLFWLFIPLKNPKQAPVSKTAYHNSILWGFVILTVACTERIIWGLINRLSKTMDSFLRPILPSPDLLHLIC